ncbi:hypothetical protein SLA2020_366840 [Shorea laevis]
MHGEGVTSPVFVVEPRRTEEQNERSVELAERAAAKSRQLSSGGGASRRTVEGECRKIGGGGGILGLRGILGEMSCLSWGNGFERELIDSSGGGGEDG